MTTTKIWVLGRLCEVQGYWEGPEYVDGYRVSGRYFVCTALTTQLDVDTKADLCFVNCWSEDADYDESELIYSDWTLMHEVNLIMEHLEAWHLELCFQHCNIEDFS